MARRARKAPAPSPGRITRSSSALNSTDSNSTTAANNNTATDLTSTNIPAATAADDANNLSTILESPPSIKENNDKTSVNSLHADDDVVTERVDDEEDIPLDVPLAVANFRDKGKDTCGDKDQDDDHKSRENLSVDLLSSDDDDYDANDGDSDDDDADDDNYDDDISKMHLEMFFKASSDDDDDDSSDTFRRCFRRMQPILIGENTHSSHCMEVQQIAQCFQLLWQ